MGNQLIKPGSFAEFAAQPARLYKPADDPNAIVIAEDLNALAAGGFVTLDADLAAANGFAGWIGTGLMFTQTDASGTGLSCQYLIRGENHLGEYVEEPLGITNPAATALVGTVAAYRKVFSIELQAKFMAAAPDVLDVGVVATGTRIRLGIPGVFRERGIDGARLVLVPASGSITKSTHPLSSLSFDQTSCTIAHPAVDVTAECNYFIICDDIKDNRV